VRYRGLKYPRNSSEFDMEMYGMKTCGAPPSHLLAYSYSPTHSPTRPPMNSLNALNSTGHPLENCAPQTRVLAEAFCDATICLHCERGLSLRHLFAVRL
jgi:hypothetical protein